MPRYVSALPGLLGERPGRSHADIVQALDATSREVKERADGTILVHERFNSFFQDSKRVSAGKTYWR